MFVINKDNRVYLNLSTFADQMLRMDMRTFSDTENKSGFINRIFSRFYQQAKASVSIRLEERRKELEDSFKDLPAPDGPAAETKERIIGILIGEYEEELLKTIRYPKDVNIGWDFRLSSENKWIVYDSGRAHSEEAYYTRGSDYIKAVLEEYARLPLFDREEVYFKKEIEKIDAIIANRQMLRITTSGITFEVKAYGILADEQNRYHYVVGLSRPYKTAAEPMAASFRLSRIDHAHTRGLSINNNPRGSLTKKQKKELEDLIHKRGVMYLLDPVKTIYVKLSSRGLDRYARKLTGRPVIQEDSGSGMPGSGNVFKCFGTELQVENYFFDFGEDVEILSPAPLREKFADRYRLAAAQYE